MWEIDCSFFPFIWFLSQETWWHLPLPFPALFEQYNFNGIDRLKKGRHLLRWGEGVWGGGSGSPSRISKPKKNEKDKCVKGLSRSGWQSLSWVRRLSVKGHPARVRHSATEIRGRRVGCLPWGVETQAGKEGFCWVEYPCVGHQSTGERRRVMDRYRVLEPWWPEEGSAGGEWQQRWEIC